MEAERNKKLLQGYLLAKWRSMDLNPGHHPRAFTLINLMRGTMFRAELPDPASSLLLGSGFYKIEQRQGPISLLTDGQPPGLTHYGLKKIP